MAGQKTAFRISRSVLGAALVGLGTFILYAKLAAAVAGWRHLLGAEGCEALGVLPAAVLATSHILQAYGADPQRLLHSFFQHTLISSWPLLLVRIGSVLSRDGFTDGVNTRPEKKMGNMSI